MIRWRAIAGSLLPVLVATVSMSIVVMIVASAMEAEAPSYRLIAKVASGVATAILVLLVANCRTRAFIARVFRKAQMYC
jgi:hypothetical protein